MPVSLLVRVAVPAVFSVPRLEPAAVFPVSFYCPVVQIFADPGSDPVVAAVLVVDFAAAVLFALLD